MVKLKRLKIHQFRNVAPGTELHFRDSFNVVLGKNGTGKTTLLNLIVSLLSWNFEPLLNESFSVEYDLKTSTGMVTVRLSNGPVQSGALLDPKARADAQNLFEGALWAGQGRYEAVGEVVLKAAEPEQERVIVFAGSSLSLRRPDGSLILQWSAPAPIVGAQTLWNICEALLLKQPKDSKEPRQVGAALLRVAERHLLALRRFDESLGYLQSITRPERTYSAERLVFPSHSAYLVSALEGGPPAVSEEINRQLTTSSDVDEVKVVSGGKSTEFLDRAIQLLGFTSAKIRLQRIARRTEPREAVDFGNLRFDFTRRDHSVINHTVLSYGQKRLLSFYYYVACHPTCVVADELVNGMHHEWIEASLEELGERQSFLTSQNPLLLDYLGFESAEEVRSSFVLCRSEVQGDREILRWENMTAEDAEGFFSAYQVGIQHVSEILRTRGLW